ncbi:hypothetical protein, partial [Streptomyces griseus]|uniref:hypothetical protein n=1 Tax=Streptomyces griseus TaxID=1911 RepID=UPI0015864CD2
MAEGSSTADTERLDDGVEVARHADGTLDERTGAHLSFRPRPADTLVGLRVRGRIKRTGLLLRTVFLALWVGQWVHTQDRDGARSALAPKPAMVPSPLTPLVDE